MEPSLEKNIKDVMSFFDAKSIADVIQPLFHYTSIETLALILKNRTIKLNSLYNVDDKTEGITKENLRLQKYYFVSCWTNLKEESIPFWKMYTPDMHGVRIALPKYPFVFHKIDYKPKNLVIDYDWSFLKEEDFVNNEFLVVPNNKILEKVEYTNDNALLYPEVLKKRNNGFNLQLSVLGKYKTFDWKFQSEFRYIVRTIPGGGIITFDIPHWNMADSVYQAIISEKQMSKDCLFLDIREDAFEKMEILIGPKANQAEEIIINSLAEKYNPRAIINRSKLYGKIK